MRVNTSSNNTHQFQFSGSGKEYFKIWITNLFLMIITLGIYSAWAKVRTKRYFYGNTYLDDSAFEYHGKPIAILKGKIIALVFVGVIAGVSHLFPTLGFIIVFVLASLAGPWIISRSLAFNARVTSYRNIHFVFDGGVKPLYFYLVLIPLVPILLAVLVTLVFFDISSVTPQEWARNISLSFFFIYLLGPYFQAKMTEYYSKNHRFGQSRFSASLRVWTYYKIYLVVVFFFVLVIGGIATFITLNPELLPAGKPGKQHAPLFIGAIVIMMLGNILLQAYVRTRIRNYSIGQLRLEGDISFASLYRVVPLAMIYLTNLILIIVTLGLAYPWTKVRLVRYQLETINVHGEIGQHVNAQMEKQSALGEEMGEAFDMGLDIGI